LPQSALLGAAVASLLACGVVLALRTYLFVRNARHVRAKVVSHIDESVDNHDSSSQSASVSRLVVELQAEAGRTRRIAVTGAFGGSLADSLVGSDGKVPVLYDPKRADVVRLDKFWALYFIPAFLCAPALLAGLLIAYVWLATH
jgi:hypothetical protein